MNRDELLKKLVNAMNTQRHNVEDYTYMYESNYADDQEFREILLQDQKAVIIKYRDAINKITDKLLEMED